MLKVKINGKKYVIKTLFEEVKMRELHKAYQYLEIAPIDVLMFLRGKEEEVSKTKLIDFKIHWLSLFSDIPKDILKNIRVEGAADLSIEFLYELVEKFVYIPKEAYDIKEIELNGVKYEMVKDLKTISGAKMFFTEGTFNQFKLSNMLSSQIKEDNTSTTAECLIQLAAVLYTNNNDNSDEAIDKKIVDFWELDAAVCWSSYFFFVLLQSKWADFFPSFMGKTTRQKQRAALKMILKEQLQNLFKKITFGKLSKLKLLNSEFLIMDWKA